MCRAEFPLQLMLLGHKLSKHLYAKDKKRKISSLIKDMLSVDTIYSSDSDCEYEIEIKRKPKIPVICKIETFEDSEDSHTSDNLKQEKKSFEFTSFKEYTFNDDDQEEKIQTMQSESINIHRCGLCDQPFRHAHSLKRHIQHVHVDGKGKHRPKKILRKLREPMHNEKLVTEEEACTLFRAAAQNENDAYECVLCGKAILRKYHFKRHLFSVHINRNEKMPQITLKTENKHNSDNQLLENDFQCETEEHSPESTPLNSTGIYSCDWCGQPYWKRSSLKRHIQHVHIDGNGKHKPKLTLRKLTKPIAQEKIVTEEEAYILFTATVQNDNDAFDCVLCGNTFNFKQNFKRHLYSVHINKTKKDIHFKPAASQKKENELLLSGFKHISEEEFFKGEEEKPNETYECKLCTKCYFSRVPYVTHMRKAHNTIIGKPKRIRIKPTLVCSFCGITTKNNDWLKEHIYSHTGETPYTCDYCGETFRTKLTIKHHLLRHADVKPFQCSVKTCGKQFLYSNTMSQHYRQVHRGEDLKPHKCELCDSRFYSRATLRFVCLLIDIFY